MEKKGKAPERDSKRIFQWVYGLLLTLIVLVIFLIGSTVYLIIDPNAAVFTSFFNEETEPVEEVFATASGDEVENGIHVETGFIDAPGMMVTIQNCTNCHSSKLVIANRMNAERWTQTIRWMQETQNLWDLGENEKVIIDYLVTNYPPKKVGRRGNLEEVEWYTLEE